MSLRPQAPPTVPEETRRVARAAFPKGTLWRTRPHSPENRGQAPRTIVGQALAHVSLPS